ncbi:hypothetical protein P168DRAFT_75046 [Aspergillus campestris IBT 28561]|uniref:Oxidoreductase-like domain-containing protein n=1 Tax=Aspergillus campestris (strain IBT 28561) TaxID=1392248 RepID=A0A2I1CRL1_ASPC2|nr:uncharacterized protein P168DRAFT_75046 [Aspergillus campestris IBT 28561]PKY00257.1 hypothetical protein P168DRAFT_75046 [Aspergillus campestris IBT 28561]
MIPLYPPNQVPRIKNAKRLTTTRTKQLVRAADRPHDDPPPPPGLGECCGSSCDPCVTDLWREELAVWRERWGEGAVEGKKEKKDGKGGNGETKDDRVESKTEKKEEEEEKRYKVPGSFDW